MKLVFEQERETKNTIRYAEVPQDESGVTFVGTLYIQKHGGKEMGGKLPERLTVTITANK